MEQFQTWFMPKGVYLLPDGTRVVALWIELGGQPRWWFVAEQGRIPGLWGDLQVVVYPNGRIYNYVPEPNEGQPELFIPMPSDLRIADLRPLEAAVLSTDDSHNVYPMSR